jgi:ABC-type multidrug transport system fused ATPase/permease subunit
MVSPAWRRTERPAANRDDWQNIKQMFPFIWTYRGRVLLALASLVASKVAMVGIPLVLKHIVDTLDSEPAETVALPVVVLLAYGFLRFVNSGFNELRDVIFA